jgi:hypothetical protein
LEQLYGLIRENHGNSILEIVVTSKLIDVEMKTMMKINPAIKEEIAKIKGVSIL